MSDLLGSYLPIYQGAILTPKSSMPKGYCECQEILRLAMEEGSKNLGRVVLEESFVVQIVSSSTMESRVSFERWRGPDEEKN